MPLPLPSLIFSISHTNTFSGFAPAFAKANPKAIILVGRNQSKLDETAEAVKKINSKVDVIASATAVTDPAAVEKLFATIKEKYGHADVLINNAGTFAEEALVASSTPSKWWLDFETNVYGTYLMSRAFLQLLGSERHGTIVNMNTGISTMIGPTMSAYSISKGAGLRLNEYIAAENPNVNAVSLQPGVVSTDMIVENFKRFALDTPELVGGIGVWLATDAARFLTGRFISANWDVEDLVKQKAKIEAGSDLKVTQGGKFGLDQFSEEEKK